MTGIIIFLIGVSSIMSWVMAFTNIPELVSTALLSVSSNKFVILFLINIILLIVGTFMDMTPACLIFTPIFLPVARAYGIDPIHFGLVLVLAGGIGLVTPPVGSVLFIGTAIGKISVAQSVRTIWPFWLAGVLVLLVVAFFPELSLWLPKVLKS